MKKIIFTSIFVLFLSVVPHAFAATQGFTALAPIPGLTDQTMTGVVSANTLATFLNNLYKYLIGLAAIIAVIQIMWAGFDMAWTHKDAVSAITDDKGKIKNAIFGLVLVLSPALVFTIINPSILNLSLNLPALTTATSISNGAGGTGSGTNQTNPTTTVTCNGTVYSQTQKVVVPTNQFCANVLPNDASGNNWVTIDPTCVAPSTVISSACSGTNPNSACQLCGLSINKTPSNVTKCTTGGTLGVLQIAWCPSDGDAKTWLSNNCGQGQQTIVGTKQDISGNVTEEDVLCANNIQAQYTFIETNADSNLHPVFSIPAEFSPLATANANTKNGEYAMDFLSECKNLGWETCVSDAPVLSSAVPCSPTPQTTSIPQYAARDSNGKVECYTETLSCRTGAVATASQYCSSNPGWSIFQ